MHCTKVENSLMKLTQALLVERIPEIDEMIATARCECVVEWMKGDCIDRMYHFFTRLVLVSMAFKRVLLLRLTLSQILDRNTACKRKVFHL